MDEVCISMDPLLEYISRKLAESEGPGALDASQLREQFKKYDIAPVAQPVLGESGEISGVVFSLAENLEHYHVAMCSDPPKDPQFHFDTLSDVYLFGLGLDSGISDDKEEGDHTMNLFSDVAMAYVNAVRGLKHLVTDNDLVSEALGGAIKDLWSKYAREVFRRIPTKADPSEDRKD